MSTTGTPRAAAIRAASTLVTMPPVPTPALPALPMSMPSRSPGPRTSVMCEVPGVAGFAVVEAVHVGEQHQQVGPDEWATSAASLSLSPNRISSVATVSFSLTTGTAPMASSWSSVR